VLKLGCRGEAGVLRAFAGADSGPPFLLGEQIKKIEIPAEALKFFELTGAQAERSAESPRARPKWRRQKQMIGNRRSTSRPVQRKTNNPRTAYCVGGLTM
jgi:hypothetical protein